MATQKPTPIIHVYKEINIGKYKSTSHYELVETKNGQSVLSNKLNISKNRNCALSNPIYWLQERKNNKWVKPRLTGLFKTKNQLQYYGDTERKKNLLYFVFSEDMRELKVYYFANYYTNKFN